MIVALIESLFLAALVAGVFLVFGLGAALMASGVLGVLACEWISR